MKRLLIRGDGAVPPIDLTTVIAVVCCMLYMQKHACITPTEEDQLLLVKSHICFCNHIAQRTSGVISKYQM